jgi:predicted ribosomally synthesized peptide with nif11-like leader
VTLQAALAFLGQARRDDSLRSQVESLGDEATYAALVGIGAATGFDFTEAELERAHALDWRMRWARYGGGGDPDAG